MYSAKDARLTGFGKVSRAGMSTLTACLPSS
jgi:hypothetical protein